MKELARVPVAGNARPESAPYLALEAGRINKREEIMSSHRPQGILASLS